ncbi:presqualene diphosphate synthase HpnD [Aristophania vespae]|uniref:presqualene diphosphate synthase HpnD n=1 Tax=Aristophania vespae TaxID=2697033 RepID=UPI0023512072|nr:presqualene diphosphate synthase HpnD [Aristophania vespae]UMM64721.1 Presqualene diphosphate synthase [Aristophania vespae]
MSPGYKKEALGLVCAPADLAHVEDIVISSGTSFGKGMRILSPMRRQAMFAIYAFCRIVDDIADGDSGDKNPAQALEAWFGRLEAIYQGKASDALDRVLVAAIERFHLKEKDFRAVIDGMLMDCRGPIIAPDEVTLDLYCDRVASAVGRLSVRIFGTPQKYGEILSHHLGRALQLTNILRDISEDARRGRLYLPKELLDRFDVPADPFEACYAQGLEGVCQILAARAHDHFRAAEMIMKKCPAHTVRPARLMAASYKVTLSALEKRGWRNPEASLKINKLKKKVHLAIAFAGI